MDNTCKATPLSELRKEKKKVSYRFQTNFSMRDTEYHKDWLSFYPQKSYFKFRLDSWGYFDPRPQISSNITSIAVLLILIMSLFTLSITWFHLLLLPFIFFGWGDFYLNLPFNSGKTDECENPSYGFYMYHVDPVPGKLNFPTEFIWQWNSYKSYTLPWGHTWIRSSILLKDGTWEHEKKGDRKEFYNDEWKEKQYMIEYDYVDKYDNTIIPTKVYVEEREWRPIWFKWTSLFAMVRRSIDVHFSEEVGSRKGSWKGGTIGCGYPMKKGESAMECIKRMELERTL